MNTSNTTEVVPRSDPLYIRRLTKEAELARIRLSNERETEINIPTASLSLTLTRNVMEKICADPLKKILQVYYPF